MGLFNRNAHTVSRKRSNSDLLQSIYYGVNQRFSMAAELNGGNLLCICTLTHACACFGGWSGAIEPGCRDNNGIPPARRTPDGVLASCINGIFDDALSLDNISSRSICLNRKLFVKSDRCNLKNENWRRNKKTEEKTRKKNKITNLLVLLLVQQTAGDLCVC